MSAAELRALPVVIHEVQPKQYTCNSLYFLCVSHQSPCCLQ